MSFVILFGAIILPLLYVYWRQNERFKSVEDIPGPKTWPIFGNTFEFVFVKSEDLFQVICDLRKKFGNLYRMFIGNELWIVVAGVKDLEICLSNQKLLLKSNDYKFIEPWIGKGLLTSTGKKWHSRRKAITPAFHFKILEQFPAAMDEQVKVLIGKWMAKLGEFDVCDDITLLSMDIICETSMGVSINAQTNANVPYYVAMRNLIRIAHERMFNPFLQPDFIFKLTKRSKEFNRNLKIIEDFNTEIITQRRLELASRQIEDAQSPTENAEEEDETVYFGKKRKMVLMDILLQSEIDGKPLTDSEVREEANTFLFAGHDTVSSALMFLFYNIAKHPEVQQKLVAEIREIVGDKEDELSFGRLAHLQYMECVIKESMRIYPPVPMFGRESQEELTLSGGRTVPSGSNITLCPSLVHADPEVFPDPLEFIPERFMQNDSKSVEGRGFTYIPFSAGPRGCIGQRLAMQEMKIVTMRVLQHLSLAVPPNQPPIEATAELVLKPRNGIRLIVSQRS